MIDTKYHLEAANGFISKAIYELSEIHAGCAVASLEKVRKEVVQLLDLFDLEDEIGEAK